MIEEFIKIFDRDLDRLKQEMELFDQENNLWKTTGSIKNSAGNLCLHLVGNLSTYIGRNMGHYDYRRDRDAEFSLKDVPKHELIRQVEVVKNWVLSTLRNMDQAKLEETYVENVLGFPMTNGFFLVHLFGHLSYHLGQINYLRRILE